MKPYAECYVLTSIRCLKGRFGSTSRDCRYSASRAGHFRRPRAVSLGFVRNAKDPQRLHNFWRSILAGVDEVAMSKWLFDKASDKQGISQQFRNAHLSGDPILYWDSSVKAPSPSSLLRR